jgi:hypothetical protein
MYVLGYKSKGSSVCKWVAIRIGVIHRYVLARIGELVDALLSNGGRMAIHNLLVRELAASQPDTEGERRARIYMRRFPAPSQDTGESSFRLVAGPATNPRPALKPRSRERNRSRPDSHSLDYSRALWCGVILARGYSTYL